MRTVIESNIVSEIIDKEQAIYPRLRDAFEALKWRLAHAPDDGELLDEMHWIFKQDGNHEFKIPTVVVIYTFDVNTVSLMFVLVKVPSL